MSNWTLIHDIAAVLKNHDDNPKYFEQDALLKRALEALLKPGIIEHCEEDALQRWKGSDFRSTRDDLEVYCFPQTWGSTALGFGGIGGAAMTSALTVIVINSMTYQAAVYFAGQFAYQIEKAGRKFWEAMGQHSMPSRQDKGRVIGD